MDYLAAVEWVRNNEAVIKGNIVKYRYFSPYEECDYMQEAFEAAMIPPCASKQRKSPLKLPSGKFSEGR